MSKTLYIPALPETIEPGKHLSDLFRSHGPNTRILLSPSTTYALHTSITLSHDGQELATAGWPTDETRARILSLGESANAIWAFEKSNICIRNLIVEGQEPLLGRSKGSEPMVFVGGNGSKNAVVQDCVLRHTRGWTCLHAFDHGVGTRIINNVVGPSGHPAPNGPWADGISAACRDGLIVGNTIIDATDGGIVLFCCPGTIVADNTIIAKERDLLGGINLVDMGPFNGDYKNCRVYSNRIISDGAYIKLGIGLGPRCWGDEPDIGCRGAIVENNTLVAGTFGYGFAAAGCSDVIIRGNTVLPAVRFEGNNVYNNWCPAATAFIKSSEPGLVSGDLQEEFQEGYVRFLIGIQPGVGKQKRFFPGSGILDTATGRKTINLQNSTVELESNGNLRIVSNQHVLWESRSGMAHVKNAKIIFARDGRLQIVESENDRPLWTPSGSIPLPASKSSTTGPSVVFRDEEPFLTVQDANGNLTFTTRYIFPIDWNLTSNQFVAIPSILAADQYRPREPTPAVTWFWLDPATSQLFLHTSKSPYVVEKGQEIWRSKNFWLPPKSEQEGSHWTKAVLQGDGNYVIYRDDKPTWASATGGDVRGLRMFGVADLHGARVELFDEKGRTLWTTCS